MSIAVVKKYYGIILHQMTEPMTSICGLILYFDKHNDQIVVPLVRST